MQGAQRDGTRLAPCADAPSRPPGARRLSHGTARAAKLRGVKKHGPVNTSKEDLVPYDASCS